MAVAVPEREVVVLPEKWMKVKDRLNAAKAAVEAGDVAAVRAAFVDLRALRVGGVS